MSAGDPDHPVIEPGRDWRIMSLRLELGGDEPYLDLVIGGDTGSRRLRFWSPRQLRIGDDIVCPGGALVGLAISDVSARGMEGVRVHVSDFEFGLLELWARDVVDVDASA